MSEIVTINDDDNNVNYNHVMLIRLIFHIYHSELPVKLTDHHLHGDLLSFEKSR